MGDMGLASRLRGHVAPQALFWLRRLGHSRCSESVVPGTQGDLAGAGAPGCLLKRS
jgi:hypothetical protein